MLIERAFWSIDFFGVKTGVKTSDNDVKHISQVLNCDILTFLENNISMTDVQLKQDLCFYKPHTKHIYEYLREESGVMREEHLT